MIDFEALRRSGVTNERLREIATAEAVVDWRKIPKEERIKKRRDIEIRDRWEKAIMSRLDEAVSFSLRNHQIYTAVDLARDTNVISRTDIPLLQYAQGKINISACVGQLEALKCSEQFVQKDESGKVTGVDLPEFTRVAINLVKSFVTRRVAAQSVKYNNLWPFYSYDPRSTSLVGKIRADALSMRVDTMADQFGYRAHDTQVITDAFYYAHSIDFPRASWEREQEWRVNPVDDQIDAKITREGICWVNPPPSRTFWDNAYPLSSINTDTGCTYIGFWDINRYGELRNNPWYFNRDKIAFSSNLWAVYGQYQDYFGQYYDTISPPPSVRNMDIAGSNDRSANIGVYAGNMDDTSVFVTNYFWKLNPKTEGIGDYPFDVWVRFVVASDATIVYAEIMPSSPAAYLGINESDSRQINTSFAHNLMGYQDQMTNLVSEMLLLMQGELLKIIGLNTDVLEDKDIAVIDKQISGGSWFVKPIVVKYSLKRLEDLQIKPDEIIKLNEARLGPSINMIFEAMMKLVALAEKLEAMAPAELGQPVPREVSATEITQMAATTSNVYAFISDGIDEFRSAKKRIIYESLIACASDQVVTPVQSRYSEDAIKKAGFEIVPEEDEDFSDQSSTKRRTLNGPKTALIYDYIFTSRDGAERPVNTHSAQVLVQLLNVVMTVPGVLQDLGKERLYGLINEIVRLSGAGVETILQVREGEQDKVGANEMQQVQAALERIVGAIKKNSEGLQEQQGINQEQQQALAGVNRLAQTVKDLVTEMAAIGDRVSQLDGVKTPEIKYSDAPADVKRQMEAKSGYYPSVLPEEPAA